MKKLMVVVPIAIALLLSACGKSPMEKLQSDILYPDLSIAFWTSEVKANSELWKEALPYCKANVKKVNCVSLRRAWGRFNQSKMIAAGSTKLPVYGSNPDDNFY